MMNPEIHKTIEKKKKKTGQFWLYSLHSTTQIPREEVEEKAGEVLYHCRKVVSKAALQEESFFYDKEKESISFNEILFLSNGKKHSLHQVLKAWKEKKKNELEFHSGLQMTIFLMMWFFDEENLAVLCEALIQKLHASSDDMENLLLSYRNDLIPKLSQLMMKFFPYGSTNLQGVSLDLMKKFKKEIIPEIEGYPSIVQLVVGAELFRVEEDSLLGEIHDHPSNAKAIIDRITDEARKQLKTLSKTGKEA